MAPIDHLMWVVPDLAAGIDDLHARTGVRAALGGSHPSMGTANAILGLGAGVYLEVLGPDPDLAEPTGFGATLAAERAPRLASWAVRTTDLDAVCASLTGAGWPATATPMTRTRTDGSRLTWSLAVLPGRPLGDHWPFIIDWGSSPHPSDSAPGQCTLERLVVTEPDPRELQRLLSVLHVQDVLVEAGEGGVRATLGSPRGPVEL
jgi:Glyoxalase-like domain